jgi:small subunit ribosomal protein S16
LSVKIRLSRAGAKKKPFYHVVAADSRMPRNGRFIELLGCYDPQQEPSLVEIDSEKAIRWLARGAQPTNQAENLLKICGIRQEFDKNKKKYLEEVSS